MNCRRALLGRADGYTLVELLVVLTMFSVLLTALVGLFVQGSNAELELNRRFQAQQAARLGLDKLRREIHCAKEAETTGGTAASTEVTLRLPSYCKTAGGVQIDVRWCTVPVGASRYALYRTPTAPCNSTGVKWADHLTLGAIFDYRTQSATHRAQLRIELPVDTEPTDAVPPYALCDVIVLRNSLRQAPTSGMLGYTDTASVQPC